MKFLLIFWGDNFQRKSAQGAKARDQPRATISVDPAVELDEDLDSEHKLKNPKRTKKSISGNPQPAMEVSAAPATLYDAGPAHYDGREAEDQGLSSRPAEVG